MITRINHNRGRRFLTPLEIESQYITEDRANSPDLLLWYDFTDANFLKSAPSGGGSAPNNGEKILIAENKSYYVPSGSVSAGTKALGKYAAQITASKQPVWVDPGDGTPPYALFNEGDFLESVGNGGVDWLAGSGDFSTSELDINSFTIYVACERHDPVSAGRQDVFFITTNDSSTFTPRQWLSFCFESSNSWKGQYEIYDQNQASAQQYRRTLYDETDDNEFHYHMINNYERYNNNNPTGLYTSMQADGIFHDFTNTDIDYHKIANPGYVMLGGLQGGLNETFEFDNAGSYHPSIVIGGQPTLANPTLGGAATGSFKGKIYEILLFKSEHAGPSQVDVMFFGYDYKRRWSNMLYYFQRKYQKITPKN